MSKLIAAWCECARVRVPLKLCAGDDVDRGASRGYAADPDRDFRDPLTSRYRLVRWSPSWRVTPKSTEMSFFVTDVYLLLSPTSIRQKFASSQKLVRIIVKWTDSINRLWYECLPFETFNITFSSINAFNHCSVVNYSIGVTRYVCRILK